MLTEDKKIIAKSLIDDRIKDIKAELIDIPVKPFDPYASDSINDIRNAWELSRRAKSEVQCRLGMIKCLERAKLILGID